MKTGEMRIYKFTVDAVSEREHYPPAGSAMSFPMEMGSTTELLARRELLDFLRVQELRARLIVCNGSEPMPE